MVDRLYGEESASSRPHPSHPAAKSSVVGSCAQPQKLNCAERTQLPLCFQHSAKKTNPMPPLPGLVDATIRLSPPDGSVLGLPDSPHQVSNQGRRVSRKLYWTERTQLALCFQHSVQKTNPMHPRLARRGHNPSTHASPFGTRTVRNPRGAARTRRSEPRAGAAESSPSVSVAACMPAPGREPCKGGYILQARRFQQSARTCRACLASATGLGHTNHASARSRQVCPAKSGPAERQCPCR